MSSASALPSAPSSGTRSVPRGDSPAITRAYASANESALGSATVDATAASALLPQGDLTQHHPAVRRLAHVVEGERRGRHGGERLHLDAGARARRGADLDDDRRRTLLPVECYVDAFERDRVR